MFGFRVHSVGFAALAAMALGVGCAPHQAPPPATARAPSDQAIPSAPCPYARSRRVEERTPCQPARAAHPGWGLPSPGRSECYWHRR